MPRCPVRIGWDDLLLMAPMRLDVWYSDQCDCSDCYQHLGGIFVGDISFCNEIFVDMSFQEIIERLANQSSDDPCVQQQHLLQPLLSFNALLQQCHLITKQYRAIGHHGRVPNSGNDSKQVNRRTQCWRSSQTQLGLSNMINNVDDL
jgi:hypothetical protein